jgi:hypothetical protein
MAARLSAQYSALFYSKTVWIPASAGVAVRLLPAELRSAQIALIPAKANAEVLLFKPSSVAEGGSGAPWSLA